MKIIGLIAEYNPFHNGHKYQIDKIKEKYPESVLIVVMSSSFTERGHYSIMNKWDKTKIALNNGIDLVVELPFNYSTQSADIFASGALKILNDLNIDTLIFGSESNNIDKLIKIAKVQINNPELDIKLNSYLKEGINYPTALNKAIIDICGHSTDSPNDLLGISYIKDIIKNNYNIEIDTIKRTNSFHDTSSENDIVSASNIREKLKNQLDINKYIPYKNNIKYNNFDERYFNLIKYKIFSEDNLSKYLTVDEGIENRILEAAIKSKNLDELIKNIKTKRYTYNKINRMLTHILLDITKEEAKRLNNNHYVRILGFNTNGKKYLNKIKKETNTITNYDKDILKDEFKVTCIYSMIIDDDKQIENEYKNKPIIID